MGLPSGFSVLHCVGTTLLGFGVILQIVGLSTPSWMSFTTLNKSDSEYSESLIGYERINFWLGLWSACNNQKGCGEIPSETVIGAFMAARVFAILGMLAGLGALGLACIHFGMRVRAKPERPILKLIILAAGIVAFVCVVISTSCYGGKVYPIFKTVIPLLLSSKIGYSLILSAIGGILFCTGGAVFYFASLRTP